MFHRRTRITHLLALILTLFMLLPLTACGIHFHKWEAASCISAKKCSGCGEKVGEPLVHQVPEDGICTLCNRKLSNVLTLESKARPTSTVVYGGVFLRMYLYYEKENVNMFPGNYTLYAEDGTQIAAGDWGKVGWVQTGPNSGSVQKYVETEYFSLQPGNYRVEYNYYTKYQFQDGEFFPDPDANLIFVDYKFTVK